MTLRALGFVLLLGGCDKGPVRDIPCVDGHHWCEHGTVCTPDSKQCVSSVTWCEDKVSWCTNGLMCTPDSKRCVTAIAWCRDKNRWCTDGLVCSDDSERCWTPIHSDDTILPVPIIIN